MKGSATLVRTVGEGSVVSAGDATALSGSGGDAGSADGDADGRGATSGRTEDAVVPGAIVAGSRCGSTATDGASPRGGLGRIDVDGDSARGGWED
jgi:hypothetical protein